MYLLDEAKGSATFSLGISRENMADCLCVNRSALSRELSLMQEEGLITFQKNQFHLHFLTPGRKRSDSALLTYIWEDRL